MAGFAQIFNSLKQLKPEQLSEVASKAKEEGDETTERVAKAIEQGYTNLYYHGSKENITEFKPSKSGTLGEGVYLETDPAKASGYSLRDSGTSASLDNAAVYPVLVRGEPDDSFASEVLVKDPSRIRSINAKFDELNTKSKNILAGAAGTAILANEDVEASEVANEALQSKVERAVADGVTPSELVPVLQQSGYSREVIQKALAPAIQPKVEAMRADGVSEEDILGVLQSTGIVPTAPYASATDTIDSVLGLGQDENLNTTMDESGATDNNILSGLDQQNEIETTSPIEALDPNRELPKLDTNLPPEELLTNINNLRFTYSDMGKELVGWSGLSNEYKYELAQKKKEVNNFILASMQQHGINAVGFNEYGEVLVQDEQTGETSPIEESILDSLIAAKYEISGAITAAVTGARAGFALGGPYGAVGGGLLGGSLGAYFGRGADVINSARALQYELDTQELMAKMHDAGTADAVMGVIGGTAAQIIKGTWKFGKAGGRALARSYDLFVGGNKQGAMRAMIDNLGVSDEQAIKIVTRWENLNKTKILTEEARRTGKLQPGDSRGVIEVLTQTTPGVEQMVKAATEESRYAGSKLAKQVASRADDVIKQAANSTNDNIGTVVKEHLTNYVDDTKAYFDSVKTLGSELVKDTGYRFKFDNTVLVKQLREQAKTIHNKSLRADFYSYLDRIKELGRPEALQIIGKQAKEFEKAKGLKNVVPKVTEGMIDQANPLRDFNNLIELRKTINELSSDSRFKNFVAFKQMNTALQGVDNEIARAAKEYMPNGEAWLKQWKMANTEYSKMKTLEVNALYKMITKGTATPEQIVKSMAKYIETESPETFMQVMGKLPPDVRKPMEGAVYKHYVDKHTVGFEGGKQAIHFARLAEDLNKLAFTQPEVRAMKRTIKEFSEVYKNDPHLLAATGNMPLPKFQSYLTADPVVRLKFEVASTMFNAVKSRIPFSHKAGRAAIVNNLAKVLDNPRDSIAVNKLLKQAGDDPELKTKLHQLAIEYTKFGYPENYGKVTVYRVSKPGDFNKASKTSIGDGVLYYTDKAKAKEIAKQTGAKMQEVNITHKTIATPEDIEGILGFKPTKVDLQDPEVINKIKQGGWLGIAMDDKVIKFK